MTKKKKQKEEKKPDLVIDEKESHDKLKEIVKQFDPEFVSVDVSLHWKQGDNFLELADKDAVKHWEKFAEHFMRLAEATVGIAAILRVCDERDDENWNGGTHEIIGEVRVATAFMLFKTGYVTLDGGYWDSQYIKELVAEGILTPVKKNKKKGR